MLWMPEARCSWIIHFMGEAASDKVPSAISFRVVVKLTQDLPAAP